MFYHFDSWNASFEASSWFQVIHKLSVFVLLTINFGELNTNLLVIRLIVCFKNFDAQRDLVILILNVLIWCFIIERDFVFLIINFWLKLHAFQILDNIVFDNVRAVSSNDIDLGSGGSIRVILCKFFLWFKMLFISLFFFSTGWSSDCDVRISSLLFLWLVSFSFLLVCSFNLLISLV